MSLGLNHFVGETNLDYSNITNGHSSGNFTDPTGAVTGCTGRNYPSPNTNVREQTGGYGYGMSLQQPNPGFNHLPDITRYTEGGFSSPDNLNASKQYGPDTPLPNISKSSLIGGRRRYRKKVYDGGASNSYYESDVNSSDTRLFAGSGYPKIEVRSQNLSGGKKMKSRKLYRRSKHRVKTLRRHSHSRYCKHSKGRKLKKRGTKRKLGLGGKMSSKLFKNLIKGGKKTMYGGGEYHQFMGSQPFSQGYGIGSVTPRQAH